MTILLAIVLGTLFGFVLQKNGVTRSGSVRKMLQLEEFVLMKKILLGIGGSSLVLFILLSLGLFNTSHFSIKSMYLGVLVGGAIFGLGWGIAGFCPGTAITALGELSKKALVFVLGGLLGALAFMYAYEPLSDTVLFEPLGGATTLADTQNGKNPSVFESNSLLVAGSISAVFIGIALLLPGKVK